MPSVIEVWFWPIVFSLSAIDLVATLRRLLENAPLRDDTKPRIAASACALLICVAVAYSTPLAAACCFLAYLLADVFYGHFYGPPIGRQMVLHHGLCILITGAGVLEVAAGSPAKAAAASACTVQLLWMEATNPLLHLSWIVAHEPAVVARVVPAFLLPALKAALGVSLLGAYAWLRVLGSARVAADVWGRFWDDLGAPAPIYFALIVALATMQVVWFAQIAQLVWAKAFGGGGGGGGGGGSGNAAGGSGDDAPPLKPRNGGGDRGGSGARPRAAVKSAGAADEDDMPSVLVPHTKRQ